MRAKLFLIALGSIICATSCNEKKKSEQQTNTEKHTPARSSELELNNGKKWKADDNTVRNVHAMAEYLQSVTVDQNSSLTEVSANLKVNYRKIIDGCTMTGPAHDQLHNFLVIIRGTIKEIQSSRGDEAKETLEKLKGELSLFDEYFEL